LYADEPKLASGSIYGSETAGIVDHVADRSEIANIALDFLRQIIGSSSSDLQKTLQDFEVSTQVMAWFEEQCQLYFEHLHHHWPVIHYTSFDIKNDPIVLVVTVILLGCLIRKQPCSGVLEAHSALTMSLYSGGNNPGPGFTISSKTNELRSQRIKRIRKSEQGQVLHNFYRTIYNSRCVRNSTVFSALAENKLSG
jgi:hypothetical protein